MKVLKTLVILSFTYCCFGLELNCIFEKYKPLMGESIYACRVKTLTTSQSDRKVTNVIGKHTNESSNKDVKAIIIEKKDCPFLPIDLGHWFPNLEVYEVKESKVKQLTKDDTQGLENLKEFVASRNPIEKIKKDVFNKLLSLTYISLSYCPINYIENGTFESLKNLNVVNFERNQCVNFKTDDWSYSQHASQFEECYKGSPVSSGNFMKAQFSVFLPMLIIVLKIANKM
jgi:Leucine rich repeat